MSVSTKQYKVTISEETYSLVSDEAEELVMRAARLVDERVARIMCTIPSKDVKKATVLASLQLASELLALEDQNQKNVLKTQALADLIEKNMACFH